MFVSIHSNFARREAGSRFDAEADLKNASNLCRDFSLIICWH